MPRILGRQIYVTPLLVLSLLLLLMSLPGRRNSIWNSLLPTASATTTFTVNSLDDNPDSNLTDGLCRDFSGGCTLRAAIQETNNNATSGPTVINFSFPIAVTITLSSALPEIDSNLTMNGPGANLLTVQRRTDVGAARFRIFVTGSHPNTINISGLTISNGYTVDGANGGDGGGIFNVPGTTLNLSGVVITGNRTGNGNPGSGGFGGGISNFGTMTIANSTISGNTTGDGGSTAGAVGGYGGGIYNAGTLTLTDTTVSGNTTGNNATLNSGGYGGGIFNTVSRQVTLKSSTVSNNQAGSAGWGGGIRNEGFADVKDSIFANNTVSGSGSDPDFSGSFTSQDYNLVENIQGTHFTGATTHNLTGVDPLLSPLGLNGGPTPTHALLRGSPAIDAGNSTEPTDQRGQPRPVDDNTVTNAAGGNASDIGAYEAHLLRINSTADANDGACTAVGTGNGCTLREAIIAANAEAGTELIDFAPALTSGGPATISLLTALPDLSSDLSITGSGINSLTIERSHTGGTPDFRVVTIGLGKTVTISDLTLANGNLNGGDYPASVGAGIFNPGTLTLNNVAVSGNHTSYIGGGILNVGILTLNSCIVANNGALGGGGIRSQVTGTDPITKVVVTLNNSIVSGNTAVAGGAGIYNSATGFSGPSTANLIIRNSTISGNHNTATADGGGIFNGASFSNALSLMEIYNSTISNNSASRGGGIFNLSSGAGSRAIDYLINCTVKANNSSTESGSDSGGGIHVLQFSGLSELNLRNTLIAGNFRSPGPVASDVSGPVEPFSANNLIADGTGMTGLSNGNFGNQIGTAAFPINPRLGALANNGGPTQTHALLAGSPALDAGDNLYATNPGLTTDQRGTGFVRIRDAADADTTQTIDVGAFEADPTVEDITNKSIPQDTPLSFSFNVGDAATAFDSVTATSSNTTLVPNAPANLNVTGSGSTRTLAITPAANKSGQTTITVTATKTIGSTTTSMSDTFVLTVKADTATSVSSSSNPSALGQTVTFTATVTSAGGIPTGTVNFLVDFSSISRPLNAAGVATLTTAFQTAGSRPVGAQYNGDANFNPSIGVLPTPQLVTDVLTINDVSVTEGDSGTRTANFTVTMTTESNVEVKVDFATANGSAVAGSDYQATSGTLTFSPGQTTQPLSVTINGDTSFESNEAFLVNLSNPVNATISDAQGTGTITNDDPRGGTLIFNPAGFMVSEGDGSVQVTVNRNGDTTEAVTVDYATSDPNFDANSRKDYTPASGTLRFEVGESVKSFTVLVNVDAFAEGSEVVQLSLANPTNGAALGVPAIAPLQINNTPWVPPPANPIDDAASFVRQHYHDFLNREPDAAGLAFWSNQITECQQPGATCNAEVRRINVSAAFFLSIEFQQTGYLVERLYKTAYGDAIGHSNISPSHDLPVPVVRLNEFLPDTQQISKGVIVGEPGWEQQLAANQVAFVLVFVLRPRFVAAYPNTMTPAEFVDALFVNAGFKPSPEERASVISEFQGAATSADTTARARVLARVAENPTLAVREKDKAFVLMQYFGYLRRNPNDPQDTDHSGYDFWMMKLNQFNGNFINAEMVKSFLVASEYRQRFGP